MVKQKSVHEADSTACPRPYLAVRFLNGDFSQGKNTISEIHRQAYIYSLHVRRNKSPALEFQSYTLHLPLVFGKCKCESVRECRWIQPTFLRFPTWVSFCSVKHCCVCAQFWARCRIRYSRKLEAVCGFIQRTTVTQITQKIFWWYSYQSVQECRSKYYYGMRKDALNLGQGDNESGMPSPKS